MEANKLTITIGSILEPFKLTEGILDEAVEMHCIYTTTEDRNNFKEHLSTILNDEGMSGEYILKYLQDARIGRNVKLFENNGYIDPDFFISYVSQNMTSNL